MVATIHRGSVKCDVIEHVHQLVDGGSLASYEAQFSSAKGAPLLTVYEHEFDFMIDLLYDAKDRIKECGERWAEQEVLTAA